MTDTQLVVHGLDSRQQACLGVEVAHTDLAHLVQLKEHRPLATLAPVAPRLGLGPVLDRHAPTGGRVIAVIPAHNEAARIARSLRSLAAQTRKVDAVIVVADNCADDTVALARAMHAVVVETVDNHDHKAGALNLTGRGPPAARRRRRCPRHGCRHHT